jgi:putative transposase
VKRQRYSEEQIIGILKEAEAGVPLADLVRKHGISTASFYAWRKKYGGMEVSDRRSFVRSTMKIGASRSWLRT